MKTIGDRITDLRNARGLTQSDLANLVGETKQTIYKYERGIVTNIPLPKIEAIAKALNVPPVALTGWESEEPEKEAPVMDDLPEITLIARAGKKMSPDQRELMLRWAKMSFPEAFKDDD